MINPQECASKVILNDPSLAVPLFDLLLWANQPKLSQNDEYDEILDMLWAKMQACQEARAEYAKSRLNPASDAMPDLATTVHDQSSQSAS